jgi:pimeloyl-ACP methyl ester carboxylesterase
VIDKLTAVRARRESYSGLSNIGCPRPRAPKMGDLAADLGADRDRSSVADANGISIHYAIHGNGSPVIFLHVGLANGDYWGNRVQAVAARHAVVHMDILPNVSHFAFRQDPDQFNFAILHFVGDE